MVTMVKRLQILCVLAVAACCHTACALTPDNCAFYAPYDATLDAVQARGPGKAMVEGIFRFVPGIVGQGILVGAPDTRLSYATKGNLDLEAGSVSVWVKPETWDESDRAMRFFFCLHEGESNSGRDGGKFLWLYRYSTRCTYFLVWDSRGYPIYVGADKTRFPDVFRRGEWVHLVGTWNGDEMRLFVNGKFQSVTRVSTPRLLRSLGATFTVGDPNRANTADTVIDELRIFDRALTAPEIEALYGFCLHATPARQEIRVLQLPGSKKVRVDVNAIAHKPSKAGDLAAHLTLKAKGNEKALKEVACVAFNSQHSNAEFSTANLRVGDYCIVSTLKERGKIIAKDDVIFSVTPPPPWLGSSIGFTTRVPHPWTPIATRNADWGVPKGNWKPSMHTSKCIIECWGPRHFEVHDALFPCQLVTLGNPVLASPIQLSGVVNGRPLTVTRATTCWTRRSSSQVRFTAKASCDGLVISTENRVEYDGLLWTTLRLSALQPVKLSKLTLDFPLRESAATLMQNGINWEDGGIVRKWHHRICAGTQVWLGNEDGGLQLTLMSARNWRNADTNRQVEILPLSDRVILRLNLIDTETMLTVSPHKTTHSSRGILPFRFTHLEYSFGLHLTPVRPHPRGWRMWRITPPHGIAGIRFQPFYSEGWSVGTNYFVPTPEAESIWHFTESTKRGNVATLYLQPCSIWPGAPAYADFASEWRTGYNALPPPANSLWPARSVINVCPGARSWGDYLVTTFCHVFQGKYKDMGWGAVYFDNISPPVPVPCDNADHGCGYIDEFGVRQSEQNFLGLRDMQRRFYVALQQHWPQRLIFIHSSTQLNMMQLAFCHGMIDGEQLQHALKERNFCYHDILTLDRIRSTFMGHNFGFVPIFLPEFTLADLGGAELRRRFYENSEPPEVLHLLGLLFLHDIVPWPAYSNPSPYYHLWAVQDAFGWGDEVQFIPYWNNRGWVTLTPSNPNLVCSIYRRPGKAMFVIMNNTDEDVQAILQVNERQLGIRSEEAMDAWKAARFTGVKYQGYSARPYEHRGITECLPISAGRLHVNVPRRNFRILTMES